jgi:hypothetical protein
LDVLELDVPEAEKRVPSSSSGGSMGRSVSSAWAISRPTQSDPVAHAIQVAIDRG